MGLSEFFLPQRLPRQVLFAGDRHAEVFRLRGGRVASRSPLAGVALSDDDGWDAALAALRQEETGLVFGAAPFVFNFFEFDKLPWRRQALNGLVGWRLQKIFPENIEAFDHRVFRLDGKGVLSVLVRRSLLERAEEAFAARKIALTYIGSSTLEILSRARRARTAPDFIIERDDAGGILFFLKRRRPFYIRKFRGVADDEAVAEIGKTVSFVRGQSGSEPRRYWLHDHRGAEAAAAWEQALNAGGAYVRLASGSHPHLPGRP